MCQCLVAFPQMCWPGSMRFNMKYVMEAKAGVFYYRRNGRYWGRLPGLPGSVEFATEYERINSTFSNQGSSAVIPGTFNHLVVQYLSSAEYTNRLKPKTQKAYRYDLDILRSAFGTCRVEEITMPYILSLRDKFASTPGKVNTLVRTMRVVYGWGIARGLAKANPADLKSAGVKKLAVGEHKPWSPEAIAKFRAEGQPHLVLAMELGLYLGQRQGDLIRMRWDDIKDGIAHVVQEKTGKELWVPVAGRLAEVLREAPRHATTILVNSKNVPWRTANVLAQAFGDEMKALGLGGLVFHGLRKTAAVNLADLGCSTKQIAAVTGQSDQMVEHYTKGADQKRLAKAAIVKLNRGGK